MQATKSSNAFECQVCFERYNESNHAPKVLPCGHSCCLQCTKELFDRRNSIACPICRYVSKAKPTSLPTNYGILDVLPPAIVQPRVTLCSQHNKKIDIYCSNCRVCVCYSCFFKDHKGHEGMEIPDDALSEMKSSNSLLSKLDVVCGAIASAVNQLNEVEIDLEKKESDIAVTIRNSFNQIRAAVDAREEALISSLPLKRLAVESHKHQLESFLTDVQTRTQSCRDLLQSSDVIQFLSSRESIVTSLSRLDDETKSTDWTEQKYDSHLSFSCFSVGVIQCINEFVQLDSDHAILKPCITELECRRVIVDILKKTRGEENWNGPDDDGNRFNWSEDLPLGRWDGIAYDRKRIQVDGNGLMTEIWLNKLGMRGMLPNCIGNLSSLTVLGVEDNQLSHLPDSIGSLSSLKDLGLANNQLTHIPDSIGRLPYLALLGVAYNPITSTKARKDEVTRRLGRAGLEIYV